MFETDNDERMNRPKNDQEPAEDEKTESAAEAAEGPTAENAGPAKENEFGGDRGNADDGPDEESDYEQPQAYGNYASSGAPRQSYYTYHGQYGNNAGKAPYQSSYPYNGQHGNNGKAPRRNIGAVVLAILFALFAGLAIFGITRSGLQNIPRIESESSLALEAPDISVPKQTEPDETKAAGPSISLQGASEAGAQSADSGYLPYEIYEMIKDSSVGILVYSNESAQLETEGSGVIMGEDADGSHTYIVTCAHVIDEENTSIKVMTTNDKTLDATVVGYDSRTDIGVLRVKATGLKAAQFGKVDELKVGYPVYSIGNPGGREFAGSFTNGMISAISRPVSSSTGYSTKCIQHTAAINPGNSGGALVNSYGQVVGINSMKIIKTDYEGMGFAVPSDVVQRIVNKLITNGNVPNRPKLGITYVPTSVYQAYTVIVQKNDLPAGSIVIESISEDSALAGEDVKKGDMITAANGKPLDTTDVLLSLIEQSTAGDKITLTIFRVNKDLTIKTFDIKVALAEDKTASPSSERDEPEDETEKNETTDEFYYDPFN